MADFPFEIPKSLVTYAEQFNDDPLAATTKLKKQLQNRGPDAVGYFLLAWFYHLKGVKEQAVQHALKAKIYAPGSPLMEKLHYYLSHPNAFDAWTPQSQDSSPPQKYRPSKGPEPVLDLDHLIARLSEVESNPIAVPEASTDTGSKPDKPLSPAEDEKEVENIASETLAKIHEMQGKTQAAIHTYERLKKLNEDKKEYYQEQIKRLEEQRDQEESEEEE